MHMARFKVVKTRGGIGVGEGRKIYACELGLLMCLFWI